MKPRTAVLVVFALLSARSVRADPFHREDFEQRFLGGTRSDLGSWYYKHAKADTRIVSEAGGNRALSITSERLSRYVFPTGRHSDYELSFKVKLVSSEERGVRLHLDWDRKTVFTQDFSLRDIRDLHLNGEPVGPELLEERSGTRVVFREPLPHDAVLTGTLVHHPYYCRIAIRDQKGSYIYLILRVDGVSCSVMPPPESGSGRRSLATERFVPGVNRWIDVRLGARGDRFTAYLDAGAGRVKVVDDTVRVDNIGTASVQVYRGTLWLDDVEVNVFGPGNPPEPPPPAAAVPLVDAAGAARFREDFQESEHGRLSPSLAMYTPRSGVYGKTEATVAGQGGEGYLEIRSVGGRSDPVALLPVARQTADGWSTLTFRMRMTGVGGMEEALVPNERRTAYRAKDLKAFDRVFRNGAFVPDDTYYAMDRVVVFPEPQPEGTRVIAQGNVPAAGVYWSVGFPLDRVEARAMPRGPVLSLTPTALTARGVPKFKTVSCPLLPLGVASLTPGHWYRMRMVLADGLARCYVGDGRMEIPALEFPYVPGRGGLLFGSEGGTVQVDDLVIK